MKTYIKLFFLLTVLVATHVSLAASPPVVSVGTVMSKQLSPSIRVTGHVVPRYHTELSSGISGKVNWTLEAGANVKRGDIVARLDATQLNLAHQRLQVQLKRKQVELQRLRSDYQRLKTLEHSQSVSEQALSNARVDMELAQSDVELLQIEVQQAQDKLTKTQIKAPFDGVVTERFARSGQAVSATQSLLRLVNLDQLEVKLHGPLAYGRFLQQKGFADVYFNRGRARLGVRALVAISDERSQTFSAYMTIPVEQHDNFDVGQVVSVSIPSAEQKSQFTVPRDALVIKPEGRYVYILNQDNVVKRISIKVEHGVGDRLAVSGPLNAGDRVIIRGAETLQDGATVRVLTANEFRLAS